MTLCYSCEKAIVGAAKRVDGESFCAKCFQEMNALVNSAGERAGRAMANLKFDDDVDYKAAPASKAPSAATQPRTAPWDSRGFSDNDLKSMLMDNYRKSRSPSNSSPTPQYPAASAGRSSISFTRTPSNSIASNYSSGSPSPRPSFSSSPVFTSSTTRTSVTTPTSSSIMSQGQTKPRPPFRG